MTTVAHKVTEKYRTNDVLISENVDFDGLLLSDRVLNGLKNAGFIKPSPIQLKAIPLGRCGLDLIVQAKSGTGKTCVFSVIALESISIDAASTQILVLAPTREIAVQIWEVINSIGSAMKGLECHTFIGGLPLHEDRMKLKKCHIAVGSPGRIKQLIETGSLRTENIRMFILDEADKLLEEGFQDQINWIYSTLPENKQMLALSATYPEYLADHLTAYMRNPTFLRLNISDPALLGIRQYYQSVTYHPLSHVVFEEKCKVLISILSSVSFQQCLVFSNIQTRASNLADSLTNKGWPTACIAGCLDQKDRNHAMAKLKTYKCRILISTDLTARGIDADKVNLVVNMDIPKDHETYLHRIGRAGRFGSFGIAISLVSEGQEKMDMNMVEKRSNTTIHPLPDPLPSDLAKAAAPVYLNDMVSSEVINTDGREPAKIHKSDNDQVRDNLCNGAVVNGTFHTEDMGITQSNQQETEDENNTNMKLEENDLWLTNKTEEQTIKDKDLTVYDLSDQPKNGLHLVCNVNQDTYSDLKTNKASFRGSPRKDLKFQQENHSLAMTAGEKAVPQSDKPNFNSNLAIHSVDEVEEATLINEAHRLDQEESLPLKRDVILDKSMVQNVFVIPKYSNIDLSKIYKQTIGYHKQKQVFTNTSARQSLKEFKEKFTGYTEKSKSSLPEFDCNKEDQDLLKIAVSQLQELFDRNAVVKVEPNLSEIEDSLSKTRKESSTEVKFTDKVNQTDLSAGLETVHKIEDEKLHVPLGLNKESIKITTTETTCTVKTLDSPGESKNLESKCEKTVENKTVRPKQNRTRKYYTNKFAIAHLLEPSNSLFEDAGNITNNNDQDFANKKDEIKNGNQVKVTDDSNLSIDSTDVCASQVNNVSDDKDKVMNTYKDEHFKRADENVKPTLMKQVERKISSRQTSRQISSGKKEAESVLDFKKSTERESLSRKNPIDSYPKLNNTQYPNINKEFTSDSESDSSSSDSSNSCETSEDDSSSDEVSEDYGKYRSHDIPFDPRYNLPQKNWPSFDQGLRRPQEHPSYESLSQYYQSKPYTYPTGPSSYYQFPHGFPQGFPPGSPYGFSPGISQPNPAYYNPWWMSNLPYGSNYSRQSYAGHSAGNMKEAMDKCYSLQRSYIQAMSKSALSKDRSGSTKKSKKK